MSDENINSDVKRVDSEMLDNASETVDTKSIHTATNEAPAAPSSVSQRTVCSHASFLTNDTKSHSSTAPNVIKYKEESVKFDYKPAPFALRKIHGYNSNVQPINMINEESALIFYSASNCGIIYDWKVNQMHILQGHINMLAHIAVDSETRWLVTCGSGADNLLTIWDAQDLSPKRTIVNPHSHWRVSKLALSPDAKYLLTLAYEDDPTINFWIWSYGKDAPHAFATIDVPKWSIKGISFSPVITEQFFIMTKKDIWVGVMEILYPGQYSREQISYELKLRKININVSQEYGHLTSMTYVPKSNQVLASCTRGAILVFGYSINYNEKVDTTNINNMRFIKILKMDNIPINVIATADDVVVTGDDQGKIKFYDSQLRILYWCQGFKVNSIKGISFNVTRRNNEIVCTMIRTGCPDAEVNTQEEDTRKARQRKNKMERGIVPHCMWNKIPTDATINKNPFLIRDFIINCDKQGIGYVDVINGLFTPIIEHTGSYVSALSVHPEKTLVCVSHKDGWVVLFNYARHISTCKRNLREHFRVVHPPKPDSITSAFNEFVPDIHATCLQYSPSGLHLACGLDNGYLLFLDPTTLDIKTPIVFTYAITAIKIISFSPDSTTMALADDSRKVCIYVYNCDKNEWEFKSKHRAHHKPIVSLLFVNKKNDSGFYKLLSIGRDRILVEYDIGQTVNEYLDIYSMDRMEQSAIPLAIVEWVPPPEAHTKMPMIFYANDQYKYKLMNINNMMTLKTVLGPRFKNPVSKLQLIKRFSDIPDYFIFTTQNLIGVQKLPLDGNPYKHVAMLGHPKEITWMRFREDSGSLFIVGIGDSTLQHWSIKYRSVDTTTKLSGAELNPYYCLLEGGIDGKLLEDMRNLFYYVQILCQGTFSPALRRVSDHIKIDALPDLMRALGVFLSEYEVENLLTEARYTGDKTPPNTDVGFEDFVKLYLNHRPAFGETYENLANAFRVFAKIAKEDGDDAATKEDFIDVFTSYGELFTKELTSYLLKILVGNDQTNTIDFSHLPDEIPYKEFLNSILGVEESDLSTDAFSVSHSSKSSKSSSQY